MLGNKGKLYYENKAVIERYLSNNNFKNQKKLKVYLNYRDYKVLNGGLGVSNKAPVISNVYKKEYSIGLLTLKFIKACMFI